jgi:phage gp46-like protein
MTSPLDLVTGGLGQASGLSLTTGGLLLIQESSPVIPGMGADAQRIDVRLVFDPSTGESDVLLVAGDLAKETGLATALLLSLFTDARADEKQLERYGGDDPRGWCLDAYARVPGDEYGSRLWLLQREAQIPENLNLARELAQQATAWMIADGVVDGFNILSDYPFRNWLALQIEPLRANAARERFAFVWG